jgi:hypothetical protein
MNASTTRAQRKVVWGTGTVFTVLAAISLPGCGSLVRQGDTATTLVMQSLVGARGTSTDFSSVLESDVRTGGGIIADSGRATLRLQMKDPIAEPSSVLAVTVTRYRVSYTRADGRNTPGVDVPYPFDGAVTGTVTVNGTLALPFILVRLQAKAEPPLAGLAGGAGIAISTIAEVTLYGHDQTGRDVSATGHMDVVFSDFADGGSDGGGGSGG